MKKNKLFVLAILFLGVSPLLLTSCNDQTIALVADLDNVNQVVIDEVPPTKVLTNESIRTLGDFRCYAVSISPRAKYSAISISKTGNQKITSKVEVYDFQTKKMKKSFTDSEIKGFLQSNPLKTENYRSLKSFLTFDLRW